MFGSCKICVGRQIWQVPGWATPKACKQSFNSVGAKINLLEYLALIEENKQSKCSY